MNKNEFVLALKNLGIDITEEKLNKLDKYYDLLIEWNNKINLTRITDKEEVYLKHFYDSLTLIKAYDLNKKIKVCDAGTGAGFPGIVLKIVFDNIDITLVDALNKRVMFLYEVIKELELKNITTVHSRIEDFAKENREKFDLVTSRAVSRLNLLDELCIPLVKENGYFIPMKANLEGEIEEAESGIKKLGAQKEEIISFLLPKEESVRNLIKIKKVNKTSIKYPRIFDKIKKNPL